MPRIKWDQYEAAKLIETYLNIRAVPTSRKEELELLSSSLRQYGVNRGYKIDEKYRNFNGVSLQLSYIEGIYSNGEHGLIGAHELFRDMVSMHKTDQKQFEEILAEANLLMGVIDKQQFEQTKATIAKEEALSKMQPAHDEDDGFLHIDFSTDKIYSFTRPAFYTYNGTTIAISSWEKLYLELCGKLFEDHRKEFSPVINGDVPGLHDLSFADLAHKGDMRWPREFSPGYFIESNVSATTIIKRICGLHALLGLGDSLDIAYVKISEDRSASIQTTPEKEPFPQEFSPSVKDVEVLESFTTWLVETQHLAERTAYSYRSAIKVSSEYISENGLSMPLLRGSAAEVSKTAAMLLARQDYSDRNKSQNNRYSAALGQFVQFLGRSTTDRCQATPVQEENKPLESSPWESYEPMLIQAFPKGFQKDSGLDMRKLRKRWVEMYGEELSDSDETVRYQISTHCVDTGKRWYLPKLLLSENDREKVLHYIDRILSSGKRMLYYSSLYAALETELESTILTEDLLAKYLQTTCEGQYFLSEHYLAEDANVRVNLAEEIKDIMIAYGRPVHTDELSAALQHLPADLVKREIHLNQEFIMDALHVYFHEQLVDLSPEELNGIATLIQDSLDEYGYMIGNGMKKQLLRAYPETAERCSFLSDLGLRNAIAYKLRDRFTFTDAVITPKGISMNMIDIFAMFCRKHTPFTLEELIGFANECKTAINWDAVHNSCARVSEDKFVASIDVKWDIPHVDAAVALVCPGKYRVLQDIRYFEAFPYTGCAWNSYLLEQYVATVSKTFKLMHNTYTKTGTPGAIVRRDAGFESFDDLLADALANASVELERKPCLDYLVAQGYIAKRRLGTIADIISRAKLLRAQKG